MRVVGLKVLKNKLSEYVRLAERGETVLVTDPGRTPPAVHDFLRRQGQVVSLASYDGRLIAAARALRFTIFDN